MASYFGDITSYSFHSCLAHSPTPGQACPIPRLGKLWSKGQVCSHLFIHMLPMAAFVLHQQSWGLCLCSSNRDHMVHEAEAIYHLQEEFAKPCFSHSLFYPQRLSVSELTNQSASLLFVFLPALECKCHPSPRTHLSWYAWFHSFLAQCLTQRQ